MLAEEYGTASNIKSRVNRLSVLSAITSTQQRLKLYNKVPTNGLIVYWSVKPKAFPVHDGSLCLKNLAQNKQADPETYSSGEIITSEGKERKINIDFEP